MRLRLSVFVFLIVVVTVTAVAQETQLGADFRKEGERFTKNCSGFHSIAGCAQVLFTDHPLRIAIGSIAPQNGVAAGLAFVAHKTPNESWRLSWNTDAVDSPNGSWRAGVYMKIVHTPPRTITIGHSTSGGSTAELPESKVFNIYAQGISLNKLYFFGLGPTTTTSSQSVYGMTESIVGGSAVIPIVDRLKMSVYGDLNGRFIDIRGNHHDSNPSIEQIYDNFTAPGLVTQPGYLQFGEGLRIHPGLWGDHLGLNYSATFQEFLAPSNSTYSFHRFTGDFNHEIPLYRQTRTAQPKEFNGPDECGTAAGAACPSPSFTRNLEGAINLRILLVESIVPSGHVVPFYLQPTLGGSDINGNSALASYSDYRFRAPNLLLFRQSLEHSIYGAVGVLVAADEGTAAIDNADLGFTHFRHSFSTGITVRAGGLPMISLLFAWGGGEGTHTTAAINTSLLGGARRPSLF